MNNKMYIFLFANCIPVKGAFRSVIYDLQNRSYHFIPNILYHILTKMSKKKVSEIKESFDNKHNQAIDEYLFFLLEKRLIKLIPEINNNFIRVSEKWDFPALYSNATIEINEFSAFDVTILLFQLEELGTKDFLIIVRGNFEKIVSSIATVNKSAIRNINLVVEFDTYLNNISVVDELCINNPRISRLIVINSCDLESNKVLNHKTKKIFFFREDIFQPQIKKTESFFVNMKLFTENQTFNSYYNRKIFINANGDIYNGYLSNKMYGNISNVNLFDIAVDSSFQELWKIKKDNIKVCKECEFRYMCVDERIPIEDGKKLYKHTTECNYNPFTGQFSI